MKTARKGSFLGKILGLFLALALLLTACSGAPKSPSGSSTGSAGDRADASREESGDQAGKKDPAEGPTKTGEPKRVGILQFAQHASLDNCREGLLEGLKEAGYEEGKNLQVDYQNAQADMSLVSQIADAFVAKKYDLILTIATPAAMGAYNATMDTDIPLVYTAVTDPKAAQLAGEDGLGLGQVTGTSDELPVEGQLQLIRAILPEAKKIGILYTSSEENSLAMIAKYQSLVEKYGFSLVTKAVTVTADIPMAADALLNQVDVLSNLLDNTVVSSLPTILEKATQKKIPVFGSEIEQVKIGCLGACGIEYVSLGKQTGQMAAQILSGEKEAAEVPYAQIEKNFSYLNLEVAKKLGISLPEEEIKNAAETFDRILDAGEAPSAVQESK